MESPDEKRVSLDDQRSVSDGDLDAEKKKRRARRRRGHRNRFKPYDLSDAVGDAGTSSSEPKEKRTKNGQPMAPSNTTQFLLEDMEERAGAEREVEEAHCAQERRRVRSISVSSELLLLSDDGNGSDSSFSEAEHREFETELEEYNIDRISRLSKDEMTREILDKDKTAEVYHHALVKEKRQNERLKSLLHDNGIPVPEEEQVVTADEIEEPLSPTDTDQHVLNQAPQAQPVA